MNRLRNRLILAFLAATVIPLTATLWITTSLLDLGLTYTTTRELDELSKSLEQTAREFYQQARIALKADVDGGRVTPSRYTTALKDQWPHDVREFADSDEPNRFV